MDATGFHSKEGRLEESLRTAETLIADGDDLAVGKLIRLLQHRHPSVPYRPSPPGGEDGQQWRGRQLWEHHLQQIQPCTCRSHCQQQEQQRLRHTSSLSF